jgi:hypothetical protein
LPDEALTEAAIMSGTRRPPPPLPFVLVPPSLELLLLLLLLLPVLALLLLFLLLLLLLSSSPSGIDTVLNTPRSEHSSDVGRNMSNDNRPSVYRYCPRSLRPWHSVKVGFDKAIHVPSAGAAAAVAAAAVPRQEDAPHRSSIPDARY